MSTFIDDCVLRGSVEITVFRNGKILAVNSRNFDGFCGIGGKVEPGESFEQAARRELMEETGCKALSIKFVAGHALDPIKGDDVTVRWYCAGFVVDIGEQEPRPNEAGTIPFWTTKEEMINNSLFPEWYAWWFGLLDLVLTIRGAAAQCEWVLDSNSDYEVWETSCGNVFQFENSGPKENQFQFCCYCGKSLLPSRGSFQEGKQGCYIDER